MDKRELISLTLDKMLEKFDTSPESFELTETVASYNSPSDTFIFWRPRIELDTHIDLTVNDPHNNSAIILKLCAGGNEIVCYLFSKAPVDNFNSYSVSQADLTMNLKIGFKMLNACHRKFIKLQKKIIKRNISNENRKYLKKLMTIFPDTLDNIIIKSDSDRI